MAQETGDGVSYLRALKQGAEGQPGSAPGVAPEQNPEPSPNPTASGSDSQSPAGVERRRSPRYKCVGSVEMREEGREVRTWATFTDISMHGCYVEVMATYPAGTLLDMKLEANGFHIFTKGTVRICYPCLGMGIAFRDMAEDYRARLRELLKTIARPTVVMGPAIASSLPGKGTAEAVPLISDPGAAVRALVQYFNERQMLLRPEFLRILSKSQFQEPPKP